MVEFIQSYGLWIALFGVFVAMHWFGMGCCGGRQRQPADRGSGGGQERRMEGGSDEGSNDDKAREVTPKSSGGCHGIVAVSSPVRRGEAVVHPKE